LSQPRSAAAEPASPHREAVEDACSGTQSLHAVVISGPPQQREQLAGDLVADEVDDEGQTSIGKAAELATWGQGYADND